MVNNTVVRGAPASCPLIPVLVWAAALLLVLVTCPVSAASVGVRGRGDGPDVELERGDSIRTVAGCTCASAYDYGGRHFENGCTMYKWPTAWCSTDSDDCGVCDTEAGPHGCWDNCYSDAPLDTRWELALWPVAVEVRFTAEDLTTFVTISGSMNETFESDFRQLIAASAHVSMDDGVVVENVALEESDQTATVYFTVFFSSTCPRLAKAYAKDFAAVLENHPDEVFVPTYHFMYQQEVPRVLSVKIGEVSLMSADVPASASMSTAALAELSEEQLKMFDKQLTALRAGE